MDDFEIEENIQLINSKEKEEYKNSLKKKRITLLCIMIPLVVMLIGGIVLYAAGQETHSNPLMISGGIVGGVGLLSIAIIGIIGFLRQGYVK